MATVRQLTQDQSDLLTGKVWGKDGQVFRPFRDINDNICLSNEEVTGCTLFNAKLIGCEAWLTDLPEIEFVPKPNTK